MVHWSSQCHMPTEPQLLFTTAAEYPRHADSASLRLWLNRMLGACAGLLQMTKPFFLLIASMALMSCLSPSALARAVPDWPYGRLLAESDLVAIVEPIENKPASDEYSGYGRPANHFDGTNTRFKIHALLKTNIRFLIGPLQYQKRNLQDEKPVGGVTVFAEKPIWLAILKRQTDGRFIPMTGHYDSGYSFSGDTSCLILRAPISRLTEKA